jgi:hypothetical protein
VIKLIALVVALGGAGAMLKSQLPEIRRYLKISKM